MYELPKIRGVTGNLQLRSYLIGHSIHLKSVARGGGKKKKFYTLMSIKAPTVEHKARDRMKLQMHTDLRDLNKAITSSYKNYILYFNTDMINFIFDLGHM